MYWLGEYLAEINRHKKSIPAGVAWTALLLSIVWVLMVAESWVPYPSSDFHAKNLIDELKVGRSSQVSFLVAGVLAYSGQKPHRLEDEPREQRFINLFVAKGLACSRPDKP